MVRTPSFYKNMMTSDVFVRHYTEVADASPVPVLLYNVTIYTGITLQADAVGLLSRHPNIAGVKESGNDMQLLADYLSASAGEDFVVLCGSATSYFSALALGVHGAVLALSGIVRTSASSCAGWWPGTVSRGPRPADIAAAPGARHRRSARRAGAEGRARAARLRNGRSASATQARAPGRGDGSARAAHSPGPARGGTRTALRWCPTPDSRLPTVTLPSTDRILLGPGPSVMSPRVMRAMASPCSAT
jgi:hypothetical protein